MCMTVFHYDCVECGRTDSADASSPRGQAELCYKHYVKGIRFTMRGPTGGRESFHNETIASVQNEAVSAAAAQGREIRPKNKVNGAFL